jgi:hypothetical protein
VSIDIPQREKPYSSAHSKAEAGYVLTATSAAVC